MRNIKYIFILLFSCVFLNVKAIDVCNDSEMTRLKELANKVEFKLDYELYEKTSEQDGQVSVDDVWVNYKINIINDNNDLKYYYKTSHDSEYQPITALNLANMVFGDGSNVYFQIYSHTTNLCTNELLKTTKVELPQYNVYYYENREKCQKYPEFKYCKEFMNLDKDANEIDALFESYLNNGQVSDGNNFNMKNIYYIIFIMIVISIIIIIVFKKKDIKKDKI